MNRATTVIIKVLILLGLMAWAPFAAAEEPPPEPAEAVVSEEASLPRWRMGIEAVTEFPVQVGGRIWGEFPGGVRLNTSLGYLPGAFAGSVSGVFEAAGAYDAATGEIVEGALGSSLVWRVGVGWRPFSSSGFFIGAGYTLASLKAETSMGEVAEAVDVPETARYVSSQDSLRLATTLHMVNAEIGWQWWLWEGLTIRAALGGLFTVGASTSLSTDAAVGNTAQGSAVLSIGESYVDETLTSYVFTPTLSLAVGWDFLAL